MQLLAVLALLVCPGAYDAVLPGPSPSPDSQGMADLVASVLSRGKAKQGGVFVLGRAKGLNAFLGQLPAETPRSLVSSTNVRSGTRCELQGAENFVLIAEDSWAELADTVADVEEIEFPTPRVLLWTWAARAGLKQGAQGVLAHGVVGDLWLLKRHTALAVSTLGAGGTTLFSLATNTKRQVVVTEIDRWSSRDRRWQRRASPFTLCSTTWSSGGGAAAQPAPSQIIAVRPDHYVLPGPYVDFVATMAKSLGAALGKPVHVEWIEKGEDAVDGLETLRCCALSAAVSFRAATVHISPEVSYAFFVMIPVQVVVPAGLNQTPLLQAVTDEFSAELWCATVVAVLGVAMATTLATRAILGLPLPSALNTALLQTLAPLLSQPPPGRTAHRPLAAVWLLMSVVIAAAYQGLLLKELTTPPGEINTLEQLEQSGLDCRMSRDLYQVDKFYLTEALRSRLTYVRLADLDAVVRDVADGRNSALIIRKDTISEILLSPYLKSSPPRLHSFETGNEYLGAYFKYTSGSPLQRPVVKFSLLAREHGIDLHMTQIIENKKSVDSRGGPDDEHLTRPLSLAQVLPAFLLLADGFVVAALVLAVEIVYHRWFAGRGGK
ncbi:Ionotropic receptor 132 [Frankliniella occidentalis]|nr:Ionotropic receptor 132 [Frankliniella occidentalis]